MSNVQNTSTGMILFFPFPSNLLSEEGTRLLVNPLEVITLSRAVENGIVTTKLEVRFEDKRLLVTHLLFPNWPDHQAPYSSFSQLYLLLDKVRSSSRPVGK